MGQAGDPPAQRPPVLQSTDPTRVTVSGNLQSLSLAVSMISDICKGTFKGFALLRQMTQQQRSIAAYGVAGAVPQPRPVYAPGYGLIPPSQVRASMGSMVSTAPVAQGDMTCSLHWIRRQHQPSRT